MELKKLGIDLNKIPPKESCIPLKYFDNIEYESKIPSDWLEVTLSCNAPKIKQDSQIVNKDNPDNPKEPISKYKKGIAAKGLMKDPIDNLYHWKYCLVYEFDDTSDEYLIEFVEDKKVINLHRLYVVFQVEDQIK